MLDEFVSGVSRINTLGGRALSVVGKMMHRDASPVENWAVIVALGCVEVGDTECGVAVVDARCSLSRTMGAGLEQGWESSW